MARWVALFLTTIVLATASLGAAQPPSRGGRPPAASRPFGRPASFGPSVRTSPLGRSAAPTERQAQYRAVPRGATAAVVTRRLGTDVYTVRGAGRTRFAFAPPSSRPTPLTVRTADGAVGVRTVQFDIDGTLVDSLPSLAVGIRAGLAALGLPNDEGFVHDHNGGHMEASASDSVVGRFRDVLAAREPGGRLTPEREIALRQIFRTASHDATSRAELAGVRAYPGARALLAELRGRGVRVIAVTNRRTEAAMALLRQAGLARHFDVVIGRQDLGYRGAPTVMVRGEMRPGAAMDAKPSPASLLYALRLAGQGTHPTETVFVGDRRSDVEAAHGAGMTSIAISHGTQSEQALRGSSPNAMVSDIAQLRTALGLPGNPPAGGND